MIIKKTAAQQKKLMRAGTTEEKWYLYLEFGFTRHEAYRMILGGSSGNPCWRIGNIEWYQAISKKHAIKLHLWTFGETPKEEDINFIRPNTRYNLLPDYLLDSFTRKVQNSREYKLIMASLEAYRVYFVKRLQEKNKNIKYPIV